MKFKLKEPVVLKLINSLFKADFWLFVLVAFVEVWMFLMVENICLIWLWATSAESFQAVQDWVS